MGLAFAAHMRHTSCVYMDPYNQIDGSIRLKNFHVNTLIDPIELDLTGISIGLKGVVYSFCNLIKRTYKHLIGLKTETKMTAHVKISRATSHQCLLEIEGTKKYSITLGEVRRKRQPPDYAPVRSTVWGQKKKIKHLSNISTQSVHSS